MSKTAPEILKEYFKQLVYPGLSEEEKKDEELVEDYISDIKQDHRSGEFNTQIDTEYLRYYESRGVGIHLENFQGFTGDIGWTYWYGGGKHGDPAAIEWVDHAYFIELEKEEVITVRTYRKKNN